MFGKKKKGSNSPANDHTEIDSAADLAQAFINDLKGSSDGALSDDRTEVGSRTYTMKVHHPSWASFWSILIWGAGFIYIRRTVLGVFTFLALFIFHLLFLSLTGVFPERVAEAFLSDIGWQLPKVESLWILVYLMTTLWSLNLVLPTHLALRRLPGIFSPRKHWYTEAFSFVPVLGFYLNGKFRWGHFSAITFYLFFVTLIALRQLWHWSSVLEPNDLKALEICFNTLIVTLAVTGSIITFFLFHALADFLSGLGMLQDSERSHTDWKFVILGIFIAVFFLSFRFTGQSGRRFRINLQEKALICEEKNLGVCQESLEKASKGLERFDQKFREFYNLL